MMDAIDAEMPIIIFSGRLIILINVPTIPKIITEEKTRIAPFVSVFILISISLIFQLLLLQDKLSRRLLSSHFQMTAFLQWILLSVYLSRRISFSWKLNCSLRFLLLFQALLLSWIPAL